MHGRKEYLGYLEVISLIQSLYRLMIELTNGRLSSFLLRKFATSRISRLIIPSFVKTYKINLAETEKSLGDYPTLHDLFVRKLKQDARLTDAHPLSIVSPVDGVIEDMGEISNTNEITVKEKTYSIAEMLGNEAVFNKYIEGFYMIIYLSPSNYHRIHSPANGEIVNSWKLGTKSYPVNKLGLRFGNRPLSKNYRRITEIKNEHGHLAVVKVGAMFVNSIEIVHEGEKITKGEELAYFTFGSTVVLLFEKGMFKVNPAIQTPKPISVGQKLGEIGTGLEK